MVELLQIADLDNAMANTSVHSRPLRSSIADARYSLRSQRKPRNHTCGTTKRAILAILAPILYGATGNRQRLVADDLLSYDCGTGHYLVSGKGQFRVDGPAAEASKPAEGGIPNLEPFGISFSTGMKSISRVGDGATLPRRMLWFAGEVTITSLTAGKTQGAPNPGSRKTPDACMTARDFRLFIEQLPRGAYRIQGTAGGNVKWVSGDRNAEFSGDVQFALPEN